MTCRECWRPSPPGEQTKHYRKCKYFVPDITPDLRDGDEQQEPRKRRKRPKRK